MCFLFLREVLLDFDSDDVRTLIQVTHGSRFPSRPNPCLHQGFKCAQRSEAAEELEKI